MVQVVYGGDDEVSELLTGGDPHPNNFQLVQESLSALPTHTLNSMGQFFAEKAQQAYEAFENSMAMRKARAAARNMASQWQEDRIRYLPDIGSLQQAPLSMRPYLMAEPNIRYLYHRDQADGYSDTYVDPQPGVIGEDHYEYRRVMNGMVVMDDDGGWHYDEWIEDLEEGDRELYFVEQVDILRSWAVMAEQAIHGGDDPTSKYNSSL